MEQSADPIRLQKVQRPAQDLSLIELLACQPQSTLDHYLKVWMETNKSELSDLQYDWAFNGRPSQFAPKGNWTIWALVAGRGFGKNRSGVEWVRSLVEGPTPLTAPEGAPKWINIVSSTSSDNRDFVVEGESGFLNLCPPDYMPTYEPSKRRLTWPNGCRATLFSAEEPESLRGAQGEVSWCDELAKWKYPDRAWSNLRFGMRLGENPRTLITTTPRPVKLLIDLMKRERTHVTSGTTYDNASNLAKSFFEDVITDYEGTRLGRQELMGELLLDRPGALWNLEQLDMLRVDQAPEDLVRVAVAVDPAVTANDGSDETGIVVGGKAADGHGYLLGDYTIKGSPNEWATKAVQAYYEHDADCIVAEVNQGGDMVASTIHAVDKSVKVVSVRATRGKVVRAEPVAALYEQNKVHHVGTFSKLEDQMVNFTQDFDAKKEGYSPDRLDAAVWLWVHLMVKAKRKPQV
jgi:phage terminase large subunit-like protein